MQLVFVANSKIKGHLEKMAFRKICLHVLKRHCYRKFLPPVKKSICKMQPIASGEL